MTLPVAIGTDPALPDEPVCEEHDDLYGWRCLGPAKHWQRHRALDPNDPQFEVIWSTK